MLDSNLWSLLDTGIILLDKDLKVSEMNTSLLFRIGKSIDEIRGLSIYEVFTELEPKRYDRNFKAVLKLGDMIFLPVKSKDFFVKIKCQPPFDRFSKYMFQDVTEVIWSQRKPEGFEELIDDLDSNSQQVHSLVNDVLDYSKLAAVEFTLEE